MSVYFQPIIWTRVESGPEICLILHCVMFNINMLKWTVYLLSPWTSRHPILTLAMECSLTLSWLICYILGLKYKSRINIELKEGTCFCRCCHGITSSYDSWSTATRRDVRVSIFRKSLVDACSCSSLQRHWINHVPVSGLRHE